jgi:hypothetical protein
LKYPADVVKKKLEARHGPSEDHSL